MGCAAQCTLTDLASILLKLNSGGIWSYNNTFTNSKSIRNIQLRVTKQDRVAFIRISVQLQVDSEPEVDPEDGANCTIRTK